ncbi:MAG: flagellar basal body rod protein FlgB [Lachnospiraceae bacterium]|nr:flagellar basal body rod protein FlgB [Lachnospiraceae bacterium]MDY3990769.1 flagellar basal body rod protein FlgB [Lachnospiraceae bacterium]
MLKSDAFSYVNLMDKALDASWLRETAISDNIANVDTPGYKRKDVKFQDILLDELDSTRYKDLDQAVKSLNYKDDSLDGEVYLDYPAYNYRLDQNNVDIDQENTEYAGEQLRYQAMATSVSSEFSRFDVVTRS